MKLNLIVILAVLVLALSIGWQLGAQQSNQSWQRKWDNKTAELVTKQHEALVKVRVEDARRINELEEIVHEYDEKNQANRAAAVAADAIAGRMHEQASRLAGRTSACSISATTPDRGEAGRATDAIVLAELFKRSDAVAGQLAAGYDRARAAGLACEKAYDALRH